METIAGQKVQPESVRPVALTSRQVRLRSSWLMTSSGAASTSSPIRRLLTSWSRWRRKPTSTSLARTDQSLGDVAAMCDETHEAHIDVSKRLPGFCVDRDVEQRRCPGLANASPDELHQPLGVGRRGIGIVAWPALSHQISVSSTHDECRRPLQRGVAASRSNGHATHWPPPTLNCQAIAGRFSVRRRWRAARSGKMGV